MSKLKPFQRDTVERALRAFSSKRSRRFLVADEVGLGKTIVAVEVVRRLAMNHRREFGKPLSVFYLCSNLAIGAQNRRRFERLPGLEHTEVDRLTLVPTEEEMSPDAAIHFYTLTANTSFPDRKGKSRAGTWQERALLHNLLVETNRLTVRDSWLKRPRVTKKNWRWYLGRPRVQPSPDLVDRFREAIIAEGGLSDRRGVSPYLRTLREGGDDADLNVIGALRTLLAKIALNTVSPDLVILDEFQRFRDLMHHDESGAGRVAQLLLDPKTQRPPAVLLLSATPYKAVDSSMERIFGDQPHHEQLLELFAWLEGGGAWGKRQGKMLTDEFREYGEALRLAPDSERTRDARDVVEKRLRRRIARTERFRNEHGQEAAPRPQSLRSPVATCDLAVFKHTAECFRAPPGERSYVWSAVPYWRSVPLPMQMLGPHYQAWKQAKDHGQITVPPSDGAISEAGRDDFLAPERWPHPQMRSLMERLPPEALATPWLAPSRRWWPSAGPWADGHGPQKALVFSRFIAVPRALSTLMSYEVERTLHGFRPFSGYGAAGKARPLHFGEESLSLFHPAVWLVDCVDPVRYSSVDAARDAARRTLGKMLRGKARIARSEEPSRELWELIPVMEGLFGELESSRKAWLEVAESVAKKPSRAGDGDKSLRSMVEKWLGEDGTSPPQVGRLTTGDLTLLAQAALDLPGVVLARTLSRYWPGWAGTEAEPVDPRLGEVGLTNGKKIEEVIPRDQVLGTIWKGLRAYLNNPWFERRLDMAYGRRRWSQGKKRNVEKDYLDHLRKAVIDGNLESLLDEQFYMLRTLRDVEGAGLCRALEEALQLRVANPKLHHPAGDGFTLRCHAVMPFSDGVSTARIGEEKEDDEAAEREDKYRADDLRTSFNSPFWPHVLVTTSVGQEGLDFHVWCDTIVHWDLPSSPVDLEQREGRINRFGGLSVRQALQARPDCASAPTWQEIAAEAQSLEDETGLSPWWILEGAQIHRWVFDIPTSEASRFFEDLQQKRMLYRLALGQPDQESFMRSLPGDLDAAIIKELTIDLG